MSKASVAFETLVRVREQERQREIERRIVERESRRQEQRAREIQESKELARSCEILSKRSAELKAKDKDDSAKAASVLEKRLHASREQQRKATLAGSSGMVSRDIFGSLSKRGQDDVEELHRIKHLLEQRCQVLILQIYCILSASDADVGKYGKCSHQKRRKRTQS